MYYKIVNERCYFSRLCEEKDIDVHNIPNGTLFSAGQEFRYTIIPNCPSFPLISKSVLHFASGALNTMLWYSLFNGGEIYSIEPIDMVKQQTCKTFFTDLEQYGALQIRILEKQNVDKMHDLAIAEYRDKNKYMYPIINAAAWKIYN